jgi:hypothetical protein
MAPLVGTTDGPKDAWAWRTDSWWGYWAVVSADLSERLALQWVYWKVVGLAAEKVDWWGGNHDSNDYIDDYGIQIL